MKILMLGWEYPPHIAGGLGTACNGLSEALARQGMAIHFIVPHPCGDESAAHMLLTQAKLCSPREIPSVKQGQVRASIETMINSGEDGLTEPDSPRVTITRVSTSLSPYLSSQHLPGEKGVAPAGRAAHVYPPSAELIEEVERFTALLTDNSLTYDFDLIHAHDWMTFPAGIALAQLTGKPLVVHVHSLERDRRGLFVDQSIEKIEREGLLRASRVIAVSHYTRRAIERFHQSPTRNIGEKIRVVHNGVYLRHAVQESRIRRTWPHKVVLFAGRVTFQKGPDYFVEVAAKVLLRAPDVVFVLAGTGDMLPIVKRRVGELHMEEHFIFPGFLQAEELEEMFSVADVYVMPSVSEPFGLTALEAIHFDTPVIISKQSGVAEVLQSALKVDFWDIERMADMIVNVLRDLDLREELVRLAKDEVRLLHWDAAAAKVIEVYRELL